jgi:transcriptional regulator with XRE-family HTH domain
MSAFGDYLRQRRQQLNEHDDAFSLRRVAAAIDVEPSYLSKVERGEQPPPSEKTVAGKVSADLQEIIRKRPKLFAQLIRDLKDMPDHAVLRLVREVRDGTW